MKDLRFSKSLPPLVVDLAIAGAGGGAPAIIDTQHGSAITFHAMENRSPTVTLTANILKADGTATGKKAFDSLSIPLDPDGASLPWEKDVSLSWNGTPTNGNSLADGEYKLCVVLTDGDGLTSPGPDDPDHPRYDTCTGLSGEGAAFPDDKAVSVVSQSPSFAFVKLFPSAVESRASPTGRKQQPGC